MGTDVIVTTGKLKGVTGFLQSMEIMESFACSGTNGKLISFETDEDRITCKVVVNSENTITIPLKYLSGL